MNRSGAARSFASAVRPGVGSASRRQSSTRRTRQSSTHARPRSSRAATRPAGAPPRLRRVFAAPVDPERYRPGPPDIARLPGSPAHGPVGVAKMPQHLRGPGSGVVQAIDVRRRDEDVRVPCLVIGEEAGRPRDRLVPAPRDEARHPDPLGQVFPEVPPARTRPRGPGGHRARWPVSRRSSCSSFRFAAPRRALRHRLR